MATSPTARLRRDPAHIKDDMRRTAERLWGLNETERERLDPLVDLLLGAFAQEIFTLQQEVADHQRRTLESAVQALLPEDLAAPVPAHAVMHGRPVDPGTWTHRTRTVFNAVQYMDVHDRTGIAFAFTPVDEFRLYNGAVRHVAYGTQLHAIDARTGQRRPVATADRGALPANEFWIGLELNERIDPSIGLPLFFSLPTGDPDAQALIPQLEACTFHWGNVALQARCGIEARYRHAITFEALGDPVQAREREACSYYHPQFITLRSLGRPDQFDRSAAAPPFAAHFSNELVGALGSNIKWLRMTVPSTMNSRALGRLQCAMNCFPVLNRTLLERTASASHLVPLTAAAAQQFWAVDRVVDGNDQVVASDRNGAVGLNGKPAPSFSVRRGGTERLDPREAYERLLGLLGTVRSDQAAFAALGETELARGLSSISAWIEEYQARQVSPGYPPVYLLLRDTDHRNTHIHYWTTNGEAASKVPALKAFQLTSGSYLAECRLIAPPSGGSDTPQGSAQHDRLRMLIGPRGQTLPTAFLIKALCTNALPEAVRSDVEIEVRRDVVVGTGSGEGLSRVIAVSLRDRGNILSAEQWQGHCDQLSLQLNATFKDLLPVRVRYQQNA